MPPRPPRPPFDILRAAFFLVTCIIAVILLLMIIGVSSCLVGVAVGRLPAGYCLEKGVYQQLHDWWSELIQLVLTLLAVRQLPPPPPPPPPEE